MDKELLTDLLKGLREYVDKLHVTIGYTNYVNLVNYVDGIEALLLEEGKMKNLDRAIIGMEELEKIIVPILKETNYQGQGERDIKEFKEDINLAVYALKQLKGVGEN